MAVKNNKLTTELNLTQDETSSIKAIDFASSKASGSTTPIATRASVAAAAATTTTNDRNLASTELTSNQLNTKNSHTSTESGESTPRQSTAASSVTSSTAAGRKYERRTKRFIWPDDLHRLFVAAVFDVGLKNASPKALLTLMGNPACGAGLTTEHLKSHLQKYRLNYDRSRVEFLKFFDESVSESTKRQRRKGKTVV